MTASYVGTPVRLEPLQRLDSDGRVIYVGHLQQVPLAGASPRLPRRTALR